MAISHARPGEVIDVLPLGGSLTASRSHALFKSADIELIRIVLRCGEEMRSHAVAGEITLQCIEGRVHEPHVGTARSEAQGLCAPGARQRDGQRPSAAGR